MGERATDAPLPPCRTPGRLLRRQLQNIRDGKVLGDPTYSSKGRPDAGISPFALQKLPRNHAPGTGGVHGRPLHPSGCVIHKEPFGTLKQRLRTGREQENLAPGSTLHNLTVVVTGSTQHNWIAAVSGEEKPGKIHLTEH